MTTWCSISCRPNNTSTYPGTQATASILRRQEGPALLYALPEILLDGPRSSLASDSAPPAFAPPQFDCPAPFASDLAPCAEIIGYALKDLLLAKAASS